MFLCGEDYITGFYVFEEVCKSCKIFCFPLFTPVTPIPELQVTENNNSVVYRTGM